MRWYERIIAAVLTGLLVGALAGLPIMLLGSFATGEPVIWPFFFFWSLGALGAYFAAKVTDVR